MSFTPFWVEDHKRGVLIFHPFYVYCEWTFSELFSAPAAILSNRMLFVGAASQGKPAATAFNSYFEVVQYWTAIYLGLIYHQEEIKNLRNPKALSMLIQYAWLKLKAISAGLFLPVYRIFARDQFKNLLLNIQTRGDCSYH